MSESIQIYKSSMPGINELHILTDKTSGFFGWLMFKHPDGQLVSLADLKPYIYPIGPHNDPDNVRQVMEYLEEKGLLDDFQLWLNGTLDEALIQSTKGK